MNEGALRGRWTAKAKTDIVLRLLQGESASALSALLGIPERELERWCAEFVTHGAEALRAKPRTEDARRLVEVEKTIEQLHTEVAILKAAMALDNRSFPLRRSSKSVGCDLRQIQADKLESSRFAECCLSLVLPSMNNWDESADLAPVPSAVRSRLSVTSFC